MIHWCDLRPRTSSYFSSTDGQFTSGASICARARLSLLRRWLRGSRLQIRAISGRGKASHKAYIAIFVCLATRAVHLELVDGYSTSAFIATFERFCARRRLPESIYSDNGTTFVGADREMKKSFRNALRDPDFQNSTSCDGVTWKFIAPSSPHFDGLWKAGVRSMKHHLRRVIGTHTLTFEEFTTLFCNQGVSQFEASRSALRYLG